MKKPFDNSMEPPYLLIIDPDGETSNFEIEENSSLFAGSGPNCRVVLSGESVAEIHCMIWSDENGQVWVHDWNTCGGTRLNGTPIDSQTVLQAGDELQIGDYRISPILTESQHASARLINDQTNEENQWPGQSIENETADIVAPSAETAPTTESLDAPLDSYMCEPTESAVETFESSNESEVEAIESTDVYQANDVADDESDFWAPEITLPPLDFANTNLHQAHSFDPRSLDAESAKDEQHKSRIDFESDFESGFDNHHNRLDSSKARNQSEEIQWLKMEVEQLRFALAGYECNGNPSMNAFNTTADIESLSESEEMDELDSLDDNQTLRLVNRLEELLEELQSSDDRVRELEELLKVSDEATQAEKDERLQLESWVSEIEKRVSQRDAESAAELGRVLSQLRDSQSQFQQTESHLNKVLQCDGKLNDNGAEILQGLQDQVASLQTQLGGAVEENDGLREQSKNELQAMEQRMLEMQVVTSREKAETARQRAELEQLKDDLEQKIAATSSVEAADADVRIRAMREHLREIHASEKIEMQEKKQLGLGGRISMLLNRVGR